MHDLDDTIVVHVSLNRDELDRYAFVPLFVVDLEDIENRHGVQIISNCRIRALYPTLTPAFEMKILGKE